MELDLLFVAAPLALGLAGLTILDGDYYERAHRIFAWLVALSLSVPLGVMEAHRLDLELWYSLQLPAQLGAGFPLSGARVGGFLLAATLPTLAFLALLVARPARIVRAGLRGLCVLILAGTTFVVAQSLLALVLSFELLLLTSIYLLQLTSKSERVLDAALEMFLWTLAGSACLLPGLLLSLAQGAWAVGDLTAAGVDLLPGLLLLLGFGVKVPVWPCFSWLLKAHVEASVEFSILLSGLIVKFGALGLARVLPVASAAGLGYVLAGAALVGMWEAAWRLFGQRDLKRVVALTTVVEMNWLILCLALGGALFERLFVLIAVAHSFTTVTEFLLAESLSRRYGSRDVTHLGGLAQASPLLWAASVGGFLVTIGFPGTSLFVAKLAFLVALTQVSGLLCLLCMVLFLLVLPLFFVRLWVPIWFGAHRPTPISGGWHDLGARELLLFSCALGASFALGLAPGLFLTLA